jgi:putative hydrolase of HD superfamily
VDDLLRLLAHANQLKRLPRTGWLLAGVAAPESIGDHTSNVGLISLFLAEEINQEPARHGLERPLDVGEVTALALIHDLAESVLTDLPKGSAQVLGDPVKQAAESRIMADLLGSRGWGNRYIHLWQSYEAAATPEARLVKDVDKLEMVLQSLAYARRGHRGLTEFWTGHPWHYTICDQIAQTAIAQREKA